MALLETPPASLGMLAPDFQLLGVDKSQYSWADIAGKEATLIMFICKHCPYVQCIIKELTIFCNALVSQKIVGVAAISSNDPRICEEDSFENMQKMAQDFQFNFPFLYDETQNIAQVYGAVCTPDFFVFDSERKLQYRGRYNEVTPGRPSVSPPNNSPDLMLAIQEIIQGKAVKEQYPSLGCSIKWKETEVL